MSSKYFIKLDIFDFFYLERGPPTGELGEILFYLEQNSREDGRTKIKVWLLTRLKIFLRLPFGAVDLINICSSPIDHI